ncbi:MAG: SHOCT domain-containing protein [Sphingomonadales bacterium]|nr:SHOCT domain-containing protein [Sphingomonadaceae bacterium]MBS3931205.1 SHOCT domain-containing protein [Sphingomonadales bacterium]
MDDLGQIDRLFALKEKGALSDDEFAQEKARVLAQAEGGPPQPPIQDVSDTVWEGMPFDGGYVPDRTTSLTPAHLPSRS